VSMNIDGWMYRVSHVSLAMVGKPRLDINFAALHSCDFKPCVNPAHLRWGTSLENMVDRIDRRGLFTDQQVRAIRLARGQHTEIAKQYGVHPSTIWHLRHGRTYRHVT
jgi:hypothetical protein